jgi:precorrin-6A/cobalt-precorrin-6A reductase
MQIEGAKSILILGGTAEASALAEKLNTNKNLRVITSLAGRTSRPLAIAGESRSGGFGGVDGLVSFLVLEKIDLLIDATHPFAERISANAAKAASLAGVRLERLERPPWQPLPEDNWHMVASVEAAASALPGGARAFLALGRQHLEAFFGRDDVHFVVRMVDAPASPLPFKHHDLILAHAGLDETAESALFRRFDINHLVCRNSGGLRGMAKIAAARGMRLPVIMIEQPKIDSELK